MLKVIGVPIDSVGIAAGAAHAGSERAPEVLRAAGIVEKLDAIDAGDLGVRITGTARDEATGVLAWDEVAATTHVVRQAIAESLEAGDLPIVLGGCCSLLPGALAGARDAMGVVSLAYLDGHLDLYDGATSPTGEAADMPIAVVSGLGPTAWCDLVSAPLCPTDGIVLIGPRDRADASAHGSAMPEDIGLAGEWDPEDLRDRGLARSGTDAEIALTSVADAFWLHLDVDVLSTASMPATDYLQDGGLEWTELAELLAPLAASRALVGISIGCFNPDKDSDGDAAQWLVGLLAAVLRPAV